jgi:hypothetical protein
LLSLSLPDLLSSSERERESAREREREREGEKTIERKFERDLLVAFSVAAPLEARKGRVFKA